VVSRLRGGPQRIGNKRVDLEAFAASKRSISLWVVHQKSIVSDWVRADFLFGQCTDSRLTENGRFRIGVGTEISRNSGHDLWLDSYTEDKRTMN